MNINAEKLFDILPDATEIFEKLDVQKFVQENKGKDNNELGVALITYILKNTKQFKTEFFNVIAILKEISIDKAKELKLGELTEILKEIGNDKELVSFFKSLMQ